MPSTVTKSIGSAGGRDYSTLQAWEDAAPANLVTADQVWRGECYNDTEFTNATTILTMAGSTTDSTRYKELTAASGQSFQDHANVRTNALTYNQSLGVGIRITNNYTGCIVISDNYGRVSRLQLKGSKCELVNLSGVEFHIHDMVCMLTAQGDGSTLLASSSGTTMWGNVLLIIDTADVGSTIGGFFAGAGGGTINWLACKVIRLTDYSVSGRAFSTGYSPVVMKDCTCFGMATVLANPHAQDTTGSSNNATDLPSGANGCPGTSNQHSVTYTSVTPFTLATSAGCDVRSIAGTALANNGVLDSNIPNDISGLARPATPTIGVWQLSTEGLSVAIQEPVIGSSFF